MWHSGALPALLGAAVLTLGALLLSTTWRARDPVRARYLTVVSSISLPRAGTLAFDASPAGRVEQLLARPDIDGVLVDRAGLYAVPVETRLAWLRSGKLVVVLDAWPRDLAQALRSQQPPATWAADADPRREELRRLGYLEVARAWSDGAGCSGARRGQREQAAPR